MSLWECYNLAICLEGWQRPLRVIGASFAIIAALIAFVVPAFIESRISFLTAPRHLTNSQKESLLEHLKNSKSNSVYFYAHAASEEGQTYAGEILAVFHQAGWKTHGPVLFSTDEVPPQGIAIEVIDASKPMPDEVAAFSALNSIGIEKLMYSATPAPGDARNLTNSVAIRVGVRPKS